MRRHNSRMVGGCRIGERFGINRYLMQPITPCPNMKQISKYHDTSFKFMVGTKAVWMVIANRFDGTSAGVTPLVSVDKGEITRVSGNYTTQLGGPYVEQFTITGLTPGEEVTVSLGPKRAGSFIEGMTLVTAVGIQGSGTDFELWATTRASLLTSGTIGQSPSFNASSGNREAISFGVLTTTNRGNVITSGKGGATKKHLICSGGTIDSPELYPDSGGVYALTTFDIAAYQSGALEHMWNSGAGQGRNSGAYNIAVYMLKPGFSFTLAIPMMEST